MKVRWWLGRASRGGFNETPKNEYLAVVVSTGRLVG
jgi:hypothetical protein